MEPMFISNKLTFKSERNFSDHDLADKDSWEIVTPFFNEYGLLQCQLESYNEFVLSGIPDIISGNSRIVVNVSDQQYTVEFGQPLIQRPVHKEISDEVKPIFPKQCIDRDITYFGHLFTDIEFTTPLGSSKIYENVQIGSIPVMVMSELCNLFEISNNPEEMTKRKEDIHDKGGYFIINGAEKIITNQQRTAYNKAYVFQNRKSDPKYVLYTEVRSNAVNGAHSTTTQVGLCKNGLIGVIIPYIEMTDIPLAVLFRALGAKNEKDIIKYILPDTKDIDAINILTPSLEQSYSCSDQEVALHYIGRRGKKFMGDKDKKKEDEDEEEIEEEEKDKRKDEKEKSEKKIREDAISYAKYLLSTEFLPHLGNGEESFTRKMFYLGYMTLKLIETRLKRKEIEDRDHCGNKRVATVGALLSTLFYNAFKRLRSEISSNIERCIKGSNTVNILSIIKPGTIRNMMSNAISNNNWNVRGKNQGTSQAYETFNSAAAIANARKLGTNILADGGKIEKPRRLDNTHWGIICPGETPEGKKCITVTTPVLTPDRGEVQIGKLKNGNKVITVNPITHEISVSKIKDHFITEEKVYKITTFSGKESEATKDHPFLTPEGWKELKDLKKGSRVYIKYVLKDQQSSSDENIILKSLSCLEGKVKFYESNEEDLRKIKLLPLKENSPKLSILARITGYMFADAHISNKAGTPYASLFFGCENDVLEFQKDIQILGFKKREHKKQTMEQKIGDRSFEVTSYVLPCGPSLSRLLIALGVPVGSKLKNPVTIPEWVRNGSPLIQREFISGFLGGDGGSPFYMKRKGKKNAYNFIFGDCSKHKTKEHLDSQVEFFEWMKKVLLSMKVETHEIRTTKDKFGDNYIVLLPLSNSMDNFINYMENVGYRYCEAKRIRGEKVYFYMKYKKYQWEKQIALKEEIIRRHNEGESPIKLAREKGLTSRQVHGMFEQAGKETFPPRTLLNIDEFIEEYYDGKGCWVEVDKIEEGKVEKVADFTTEFENHSFIADGFVTHNCGLITNQAMCCIITIGSSPIEILEIIENMKIISFDEVSKSRGNLLKLTKIFVNGDPVGVTKYPENIVNELRMLRRTGGLNSEVSISYDCVNKEINISTEAGRMCRPLLIVEDGKILLKKHHIEEIKQGKWDENPGSPWCKLLSRGFIELIDKAEEETTLIATYPDDLGKMNISRRKLITHCEIHPSSIFGVGISLIPYPDHNQCIFEDEIVYMIDGSFKKIKDIKTGDSVITFDPENGSHNYTKIVHTYNSKTDKKVYEVETISGRKIRATFDHKFMTSKGWEILENIQITDMKNGDSLIGISLEPMPLLCSNFSQNILNEEKFMNIATSSGIKEQYAKKYSSELKKLGLLPLVDPLKINIISRIFGFSLADMWLGINDRGIIRCSADFGHIESAKLFIRDLEFLGFRDFSIKEDKRNRGYGDTYKIEKSGSFPALLVSLGRFNGKRKGDSYYVPNWVLHGTDIVKREFLSGFQGGDGCKIRWNRPSGRGINFVIGETIKTTSLEHLDKMEDFMKQITSLFNYFNIEVSKIVPYSRLGYIHCGYKISNKKNNLVRYFDTIGYRYDVYKSSESGIVIEYVRYLEKILSERTQLVEKIKNMRYNLNLLPSIISQKLNIDVKEVYKCLKLKEKTIGLSLLEEEQTIERWLEIVKISPSKSSIFVPVAKKIEVYDSYMIADITTESNNQSFLCGDGFCVHNSPRNTYQASMGKQSIGVPGTNYNYRTKGKFHVLNYPQKPVVSTKMSKIIGFDDLPAGQNSVIMIIPWYGYNQEDSLMMGLDPIDRDFMGITTYMAFDGKTRIDKGEKFEVPTQKDCSNFRGNPSKLDPETGIIKKGCVVNNGDILIGRTKTVDESSSVHRQSKQNISVMYDHVWPGKVHFVQQGVDGEGYNYVRVMIVQQRPPQYGDKFCYTPDHEVLTTEGWVGVSKITKEHKVATLKHETHTIEYQNPTEIFEYDHKGEMINVENKQLSLCVTPNHKMYVKRKGTEEFKLEEAKDLENLNVYYKKNGTWNVPGLEYFILPSMENESDIYASKKLPIKPWLTFFGMWLSQGSAEYFRISINIHSEKEKQILILALEKLYFEYKISDCGTKIYIYDRHLCKYINSLPIQDDSKKMEEWTWDLNEEQSRYFIKLIVLSGGRICENDYVYYTFSSRLKDDFMRLALHCGWAANANIKYFKNPNSWEITVVKILVEPLVHQYQQGVTYYEGKVHCFSVPNHIIYVRRCQKPVWSSNSSRHGQKGTVGMTYRSCDLPYTKEGISPDIIINPLAFPSRMTIGMLIEAISGRAICDNSFLNRISVKETFNTEKDEIIKERTSELGERIRYPNEYNCIEIPESKFADATPFERDFSLGKICKELKKMGIDEFCDEEVTNGITGKKLKCLIFTGVCYYQRLKHMVIDKFHSRARGGRNRLTRQPPEGRKSGGGFRVGHMERDCLVSQGCPYFAKDRLMEQSDETIMHFCKICGLPARKIPKERKDSDGKESYVCDVCGTKKIAEVKLPYATKLLMEEYMGMNVVMRVLTTPYGEKKDIAHIFSGNTELGFGVIL